MKDIIKNCSNGQSMLDIEQVYIISNKQTMIEEEAIKSKT